MKVKCPRDSLLTACVLVGTAVAGRTTKPVLSNIKVIAETDSLTLMATDLEVGIRYEMRGVEVLRAGSAIWPVASLIPVLRETLDDEIITDSTPNGTTIRTGTGVFELLGGDPEEFPDLPKFDSQAPHHEIVASLLRTMIRRVAFAADKKEGARWAVTGILWETEPDKARLVATDTRRLALMEANAIVHMTDPAAVKGPNHLIPHKAIQLLDKSLVDDAQPIKVVLKDNEAMFQAEHVQIHTRLVEGKFPPYKDIIPKKHDVKLSLNTSQFLTCVRQSAIMVDEEVRRIDCNFAPGKLTLRAKGAKVGSSDISMTLPDYEGKSVDISFDPGYLIDMLRAVDGEPTLTLEMVDGKRPAIFRAGDSYLYLVMPLAD